MEQHTLPICIPMFVFGIGGHPLSAVHPFLDDPAVGPDAGGADPQGDMGGYQGDMGDYQGG